MEPFSKELKVVLLYSIKTVVSHLKFALKDNHSKTRTIYFSDIEMSDAINAEVEAAANNFGVQPEASKNEVETLLVKTRLRHGKISDSDDDKVVWNERWTPPDDLLAGIFDKFKNVAEADMEIYRVEETGVIRIKIIHNTSSSMRSFIYAIIEIVSNTIYWIIDNIRHFLQLAGNSEAELKKEEEAEDLRAPVMHEEDSEGGFTVVNIETE